MNASQRQTLDLIRSCMEAMADDEEVDWEVLVREEELHALVTTHKMLTEVMDEVEAEMEFRADREMKLAAGTDSEREYVESVVEARQEDA